MNPTFDILQVKPLLEIKSEIVIYDNYWDGSANWDGSINWDTISSQSNNPTFDILQVKPIIKVYD